MKLYLALILSLYPLALSFAQDGNEKSSSPRMLLVGEAELTGSICRYQAFRRIGNWYNTQSTVTFRVNDLDKGEYEIWINYGASPYDGGGLLLLTFNGEELRANIRPTKSWVDFADKKVGIVNHNGGAATIILRALRIRKLALMDMTSLTLKKVPSKASLFDSDAVTQNSSPIPQQQPTPSADHQRVKQPAPTSGVLLTPLRVELKHNGKAVGSTTLQAGTSLPVVKRDGARALVKHAGGESWIQAASEWDVTPITDLTGDLERANDLNMSIQASIVIAAGEPCIAWVTRSGLFYAERKANRWEIEKIDGFEKIDYAGQCRLRMLGSGKPCIAYAVGYRISMSRSTSTSNWLLKIATRENGEWKLQMLKHDSSHGRVGRLDVGEWKSNLAVLRSGAWPPTLWTLVAGAWGEQIFKEGVPSNPKDGLFSQGKTLDLLGSDYRSEEGREDTKYWVNFSRFDSKKWDNQKIQGTQTQIVIAHFLASYGEHVYASFSTASNNRLNLARRSDVSWEIMPLDPGKLLEVSEDAPNWDSYLFNPWAYLGRRDVLFVGMDASGDNKLGLLIAGDSDGEPAVHYGDVTFPQLCLSEKVTDGFPCDFTFDENATPHIVFVSEEGKLSLATRKHSVQIAASKPEGGILQLPEAARNVHPATTELLPEKIHPGSEQERLQRIAVLGEPQKLTLPVAGKDARFIRWGRGDKAIVFFTPPPKWRSGGVWDSASEQYKKGFVEEYDDSFATVIAAQIDAYAPLLENGYSVIVWDYPEESRDRELKSEINEALLHPDHSGVASALVESLREQAGLTEMILIGNGNSSELLLGDLAALEKDEKSKVILVSPNLYILPNLSKLPPQTKAVVIANPYPSGRNPEAEAWVKNNRSKATDTLASGGGYPQVGADIGHETFAKWLLNLR